MPAVPTFRQQIDLPDEPATRALAGALAGCTRAGDVIALRGELGAGKTAFARSFINALPGPDGAHETVEVPSPTFTLLQIYERLPAPVWHFDLYRLETPQEAHELGIEEALGEGITLIEWPERLGSLLPEPHLDLHLEFCDRAAARRATVVACGDWVERLQRVNLAGLAKPASPDDRPQSADR